MTWGQNGRDIGQFPDIISCFDRGHFYSQEGVVGFGPKKGGLMNSKLIMIAAASMILGSGCAVNRTLQYSNLSVSPSYRTDKTVMIAFQDKREDVLSGKRKETFCGQLFSTAQIGYNINTESGKTLAQDFAQSFKSSFDAAGIRTQVMDIAKADEEAVWMKAFTSSNAERLLKITINKWEARGTPLFVDIRYELFYDFTLSVYNKEGTLLASSNRKDNHMQKEGQLSITMKKMQEISNDFFTREMNAMLNEDKIKAALQ